MKKFIFVLFFLGTFYSVFSQERKLEDLSIFSGDTRTLKEADIRIIMNNDISYILSKKISDFVGTITFRLDFNESFLREYVERYGTREKALQYMKEIEPISYNKLLAGESIRKAWGLL